MENGNHAKRHFTLIWIKNNLLVDIQLKQNIVQCTRSFNFYHSLTYIYVYK